MSAFQRMQFPGWPRDNGWSHTRRGASASGRGPDPPPAPLPSRTGPCRLRPGLMKASQRASVNRTSGHPFAKSGLFVRGYCSMFQASMRSTKIVATIGPASLDSDVLRAMVTAGMDVARLNFAHGTSEQHADTAVRLRSIAEGMDREGAILGDLPGPKLRIGPVKDGVTELTRDSRVVLTADEIEGTDDRLPVAWPGFSDLVEAGDVCYLADGAGRLRGEESGDSDVVTKVEVGGSVASRQGLNLPNVTVSLPAVSAEDIALIDDGLEMGLDYFALSFVRRREDLDPVREHLSERGADVPLIAKVEKPQAAANGEEIVDAADGIMIARGDLGIELPIEEVPLVQKRLLALAGRHAKPSIATTTERELPYGRWLAERGPQANNQYHALSFGAVGAVYQLGLKCIVSPTNTGTTARLISAYRPRAPVLALSPRHEVVRRCLLLWGVHPQLNEEPLDTLDLIDACADAAVRAGMAVQGDTIGITAGLPAGRAGGTNLFKVH